MQIKLAETAGFCFGVNRAVDLVEQAVREGKKVATLGPIIHNHHVMEDFARSGVREISEPQQANADECVVIRSHGVSKEVYEALSKTGAEIIDATCPFVKKIHTIISKAEENGQIPVIIGTKTHPEVVAIAGWCKRPMIFETPEEFENWLNLDENNPKLPLRIVSQTTNSQNLWKSCCEIAKKVCTNAEIFDTICKATEMRQNEAAALASECDAMIVIGDKRSSNTGRLAMICREKCSNVQLIDSAEELDSDKLKGAAIIGVTAGASTPARIIKEVNKTMSENVKVENAMEDFEALLDQSFKTLNNGDKVTGTVMAIGSTEIQVDLGTKHTAYISLEDFTSDPNAKIEDLVKVGDEIEAIVVHVSDSEGVIRLSKKRLEATKAWEEIQNAVEEKTVFEGVVTEENKGGVVVNVKGIRVFVPASQTGIARGGDLGELLKKTVQLRLTEVNPARRRVVGSIRSVAYEARKAAQEKIWSEIEVGKHYKGVVKSLTSYGAFVDIGGVDGMVHVSELSWNRIKNPSEVVKVGDEIEVFVLALDPEKKKISLGYKTPESNPWTQFEAKYQVGDVATVKVVKLMDFGAFAEIVPGVDGLIHISQIADRRIAKPDDVLAVGQEVEAKIIDIDAEHKRISLSIRALIEPAEEAEEEAPAEEAPAEEAAPAAAEAEEAAPAPEAEEAAPAPEAEEAAPAPEAE